MGWDLRAHDRDVAQRFPFPDGSFDRVYSICTVEHLTSPTRQAMMREVGRILKPGGIAAITMCYDPDHKVLLVDKGLRFGFREKLEPPECLTSSRTLATWPTSQVTRSARLARSMASAA